MLLALLACTPAPEPWVETRAACGLAGEEVAVYPNGSIEAFDEPFVYTEGCARAVGDDLGVDWEAFGPVELPGYFRGSTLERALAGAWLVLAMDAGTVEDLLAHPDSPESLRDQLREVADQWDIPDEAPASRVVYDYVADRIVATVPNPGRYRVGMASGTLRLPTENYEDRVYSWMSTILHESAHGDDRPHVDCETGERVGLYSTSEDIGDDSWEGAYGVEFFLVARYRARLSDDYWREMLHVLAQVKYRFCPGVEVPPDIYEYDEWE